MKKIALYCAFIVSIAGIIFAASQQPPYEENNWETNENMRNAYLAIATHQHDGKDGSKRMPWLSLSTIENPTANNTATGECGVYARSGYIVLFCNNAGAISYSKIQVGGTVWTTGAP
jgi:hypothetical protein